jgi:mutator protein MutT
MKSPLKKATLLFLIKDKEILLAMKKRGFGKGRWNGVGGKPEANESIEDATIRECKEEIGVTPQEFTQVATLDFFFPDDKPDWNQQVLVYLCTKWQGVPIETEEMKPIWYSLSSIPYGDMWEDDEYWLPKIIEGNYVEAMFRFDNNDKVLSHKIKTRPIKHK